MSVHDDKLDGMNWITVGIEKWSRNRKKQSNKQATAKNNEREMLEYFGKSSVRIALLEARKARLTCHDAVIMSNYLDLVECKGTGSLSRNIIGAPGLFQQWLFQYLIWAMSESQAIFWQTPGEQNMPAPGRLVMWNFPPMISQFNY